MAYVNRQFADESSGLEVANHDYSDQPGLEAVSGQHPGLGHTRLQSPAPLSAVSDPTAMGHPNAAQSGYYGQTPHQEHNYTPVGAQQDPPPPFFQKQEHNANAPGSVGVAGFGDQTRQERRICGLKRWLFILLVILAIVIVAAALGGGIGGSLANKHPTSHAATANATSSSSLSASSSTATSTSSTTSSTTTATTATSTPSAVAAAEFNDATTIGVFYQDGATGDLFISGFYGESGQDSTWHNPLQILGLNPAPKANSSIAAVYNLTDEASISIYYAAANNTVFNAYGTVSVAKWTMGTLAPDTNYGVLLADDGGIAANPWIVTGEEDSFYSTRVYYIDRATNQVKELAADFGLPWSITSQTFETAGTGSKIATAWLPADNFTYTTNQVQHLFYMDERNNVRHYPGYNGIWNSSYIESIANLAQGQPFASTVWTNATANNPLRLFWLESGTGRFTTMDCKGASPYAVPGFQSVGTCGGSIDVEGFAPTVNSGDIDAGPIAAVAWEDQVRVYYLSATDTTYLTEVELDGSWSTTGTTSAGRTKRALSFLG